MGEGTQSDQVGATVGSGSETVAVAEGGTGAGDGAEAV